MWLGTRHSKDAAAEGVQEGKKEAWEECLGLVGGSVVRSLAVVPATPCMVIVGGSAGEVCAFKQGDNQVSTTRTLRST
jgi:hypothetical protein